MKLLTILAAGFAATGCASGPIALANRFDEADFAWAQTAGPNSLEGLTSLVPGDGIVRTCARREVSLVPETPYTRERMPYLYGNAEGGYLPARRPLIAFRGETYVYADMVRKTVCDPEGRFRFTSVPDGSYFVIAEVMWREGGDDPYKDPRGGRIMKRVTLVGGDTRQILLHW